MTVPVLDAAALRKSFGALTATQDVSLTLLPGEIHALIGPNGAGKSTLIGLISGALRPDAGQVLLNGQDVTRHGAAARARRGLARSFQISAVLPDATARDNALTAALGAAGLSASMWRRTRADAALAEVADTALARAGLADRAQLPAARLSHGERRRLELAMALAMRPRAFLLDEPMAGLGTDGSAEMTETLRTLRKEAPILLVEHDMDAVFALADRITVLDAGRVLASGPPDSIRADPLVRRAYLGEAS
jgi:branched-chain amino acid transport system ATP-binding protein